MTTAIDKRLRELERRLQPSGRMFVAWPTDNPDLYELDRTGALMTLAEIRARLAAIDTLLLVIYDDLGNHDKQNS